MKVDIKVPAMGESISEATVGAILKPSGSQVATDDEILELETDKVNQVLYSPQSGVITLSVSTDDVVKIGDVLGYVDSAGEEGKPSKTSNEEEKKTTEVKEEEKSTSAKSSDKGARLTKENYVKGAIEKKKPEKAKEKIEEKEKEEPKQEEKKESREEATSGKRETRRRMTKIRRIIASRLLEAQATTAMLTSFNEVDLTSVIDLRTKYKDYFLKEYGTKLGFMSFFVKASVSALMAFPNFNSYVAGEDIVHREYFDIGIAVGTDRGLIVPVVRDCEKLSFAEIEKSIETFAQKAREGSISVDDLQGGGFTITNGGVYGSLLSTPILNPPQSGILGMHKIQKRPVVVDDEIVIRPMMYLALSYDHRIIDGKEAVSFLIHIKNCLEDPSRLLLGV